MNNQDPCPCGSGVAYGRCCGVFIEAGAAAPTAETLMRSRYSAYVLGREAYLLATWDPATRPVSLDLHAGPAARWLGLKILRREAGGADDDCGVVEFVARFKINGRAERLHEVSRFSREHGVWFYVDGVIQPPRR